MFEIPKHPEAEPITDAVELAFWGHEFQPDERISKHAPEGKGSDLFDVHVREKNGFDPNRKCAVLVKQVRCLMYDEGHLEPVNIIYCMWDDGLRTAIDTVDLYTVQPIRGQRVEEGGVGDMSKQELIQLTMQALSEVTDLTS